MEYIVVGLLCMVGTLLLTRTVKDKEKTKKIIGAIFLIFFVIFFVITVIGWLKG